MRRVLAAPVRGEERGEVRQHLGCQHCHNLGHNLLWTTRNCRQKVQFSFGLDLAINNKSWNLAWLLQMKRDYLRKSINKKNWFLICVLCPIYPDVLDYDCVNSCCDVDEILHKILIQGVSGIHHWQVERSDLWLRLTPACPPLLGRPQTEDRESSTARHMLSAKSRKVPYRRLQWHCMFL